MCISPSIAGTISTEPANRNAYSASGSTKKPTSMQSGANTMQKPATILRKWWASEIPNIEPSLLRVPALSRVKCIYTSPDSRLRKCIRLHAPLQRPFRAPGAALGDTQHMDDPVALFEEAVAALNRVDRADLQRLLDPEI